MWNLKLTCFRIMYCLKTLAMCKTQSQSLLSLCSSGIWNHECFFQKRIWRYIVICSVKKKKKKYRNKLMVGRKNYYKFKFFFLIVNSASVTSEVYIQHVFLFLQVDPADGRDHGWEREQDYHLCGDQEAMWRSHTQDEAWWVSARRWFD